MSAPTCKERLRHLAEHLLRHPRADFVLLVLILINVGAVMVEAAWQGNGAVTVTASALSYFITALFAIELSARLWIAPSKPRFFRRYWLDLLSLLPLAGPLRILVLLRLFRAGVVLNRRLSLFGGLIHGRVHELALILTLTLGFVLPASTCLAVHADVVEGVPKASIGASLWYSLYTFMAAQPPGEAPHTWQGRVITLLLIFGGLNVFGVFVGTVSATMMTALSNRMEVTTMDLDELSDHLIVLGWNGSAPVMLRELFGSDRSHYRGVVVVTEQRMAADVCPREVPRELLFFYTGDCTRIEVLDAVGIKRASRVILLADTLVHRSDQDRDARTVLAALTIERMAPDLFCCAELVDGQHEPILRMAGVEEIVVTNRYSGLVLGNVLRNLGLMGVLDDLLTARTGNGFYKVLLPASWAGRTADEASVELKAKSGALLVSIERSDEQGHREEHVNPASDMRLLAGDQLVIIARGPATLR